MDKLCQKEMKTEPLMISEGKTTNINENFIEKTKTECEKKHSNDTITKKKCSKCSIEKELINFGKHKIKKDGLSSCCKQCKSLQDKEYRNKNKEKIKAQSKIYVNKNKETIKIKKKQYHIKHRDEILCKQKEYRNKNKEIINEKQNKRYNENKEIINKERRQYYHDNKAEITEKRRKCAESINKKARERYPKIREKNKEKCRKYGKSNRKKLTIKEMKRYHSNPNFKLKKILRSRLYDALNGNIKNGSAVEDLGCSIEFLIKYIETKFTESMTWDNYGEWHIDHIKPLASFDLTDRKQLLEACHYTNLQPLWAKDNLSKGAKINWKLSDL